MITVLVAGAGVVGIALSTAIVIGLRRRCPACQRRGLASEGHGWTPEYKRYKRVRCVHCKAEFAHVDGGYVPINGTIVVPEAKATIDDRP